MKRAHPPGISRRRVQQLLSKQSDAATGDRVDFFSRHFLGHPYTVNPLIGTADTPEVFTVSLEGFDCVTYVETVLALARASNVDEFVEELRNLRYEEGRVEWSRRNHYMTEWLSNGVRHGAVRRIQVPAHGVVKRRLLNVVPGLPPRRRRFQCVPKPRIDRIESALKTGDLIFFASTRPHLDVFHCGIIVRSLNGLRLRHAARSRNGVVEQDLAEFLKSNRMSGVIVARPEDKRR